MTIRTGEQVDTRTAQRPMPVVIEGRTCRLRPLDPARDAAGLYDLSHGTEAEALWAYLFTGPYASRADFDSFLQGMADVREEQLFWAIADRDDRALGWLSLMRIEPAHRVIEVGSILYTPPLQRSVAATEAQYLLARHVFDTLGYRRYEWKCNDLNAPSKRAAIRFGFHYEGLFRQHMIVKGRNRDTAWFSMLDGEWPARRAAYEAWLQPGNFDADGRQKQSLSALMASV